MELVVLSFGSVYLLTFADKYYSLKSTAGLVPFLQQSLFRVISLYYN